MKKEPFCITPQMAAQKAADSDLIGLSDSPSDKKNLIKKAFALGFMISREGFNGDCICDHIAPDDLDLHWSWKNEEEFLKSLEESAAFQRLMKRAVQNLTNE